MHVLAAVSALFTGTLVAGCGGQDGPRAVEPARVEIQRPAAPKLSDNPRSAALIKQLRDQCVDDKSSAACFGIAAVYSDQADVYYDPAQAETFGQRGHQLQRDACRSGDAQQCRTIVAGVKLQLPKSPEGERSVYVAIFFEYGQLGCTAGDYDLCLDVAAEWDRRGDAASKSKAAALTTFACDHNFQAACVEVALTLTHPNATQAESVRAAQLLGRACDTGSGEGCGLLAVLHLRGAVPDQGAARKLAQRACDLHDPAGCAVLGHCLLDGIGGPVDRAAAITALSIACEAGESRGCQQLSILGER